MQQQRVVYSSVWDAWEAVSNQRDAKEQAIVLHHLASTLCKLGNYAQAKELAEQGLAMTGSLDEKQLRSRLLQTLGDIADNEGDGAHAEAYYHEGLQLARHTQDTLLLCSLSINFGKIAWFQGRQTQALHYYEEAMQLARQHQYLEELGMGFFSFETAGKMLQGYECMHMIRKGQMHGVVKGDITGQVTFITRLFGVAA